MSARDDWPFDDPPATGVVTIVKVQGDGQPVLLVTHDEADGGWQFLCGTTDRAVDVRTVDLEAMVRTDPSLREIADLPLGWRAWRASVKAPWRRGPLALGPPGRRGQSSL
jgi:hypothetical protein